MKVRLYLDEDCSRHSFVRELRVRGADVVSALEAGRMERPDGEHLEWAARNQRALYSFNRGDFCRLHANWLRQDRSHSGVILSRQDLPVGEQMRRLLRSINRLTAEEMQNRLEFLSNWSETPGR
jgi:hypothetical protein